MTQRTCDIPTCDNLVGRHGARGWCATHYKRWRKNGDAATITRAEDGASDDARLRFYLDTSRPDDCWEWQGSKDHDGYGRVSGASKPRVASRVAYETWVGPIPDGHVICHRCDNPPCCNPAHLFAGTARDNTHDMLNKHRGPHGERHSNHKLTDEDVRTIRSLSARGWTQRSIAAHIGCSQSQVSNIVRRAQRAIETVWVAA